MAAKKFASVVGLHKVFKQSAFYRDLELTDARTSYLPELLDTKNTDALPIDDNSILFITADSSDNGFYTYVGQAKADLAEGLTYTSPIYIHTRDTFIWALGRLIAGSDSTIESLAEGAGDNWIDVSVTNTETGAYTIQVTHNSPAENYNLTGENKAASTVNGTSGNSVPVITSITVDATGHVTGISTEVVTDTTYTLAHSSNTVDGNVIENKDTVEITPITKKLDGTSISGTALSITIDEVLHVRYSGTNGSKIVTSVVNNSGSNSESEIMTAAAVQSAILAKVEAGVAFKGVDSLSNVLTYPDLSTESTHKVVANGEMYKLNAGGTLPKDKSATNEAITVKIGDVLVAAGKYTTAASAKWYVIPSGDDIEDSWRVVKVNNTEFLTSLIANSGAEGSKTNDGMALNLIDGTLIGITVDDNQANGNVTISHKAPFETKPTTTGLESGYYISGITIDNYGHITGISSASIADSISGNINTVNLTTVASKANTEVQIGISAVKNDGTSTTGTSVDISGSDGASVTTDEDGAIVVQGTTYSVGNTMTVSASNTTDSETGETLTTGALVQMALTASGATTGSSTSSVIIKSSDKSIDVSASTGTVEINYTGVSTADDWVTI